MKTRLKKKKEIGCQLYDSKKKNPCQKVGEIEITCFVFKYWREIK